MPVFITLACVLFPIDDDLPVRRQNVRDGVAIPVLGVKHPIFVVQRIATGVPGVPKNLIFASINTKPELFSSARSIKSLFVTTSFFIFLG